MTLYRCLEVQQHSRLNYGRPRYGALPCVTISLVYLLALSQQQVRLMPSSNVDCYVTEAVHDPAQPFEDCLPGLNFQKDKGDVAGHEGLERKECSRLDS